MNRFIILTDENGDPLYINWDCITSFGKSENDDDLSFVRIVHKEDPFDVKEAAHVIFDKIVAASNA